MEAVRGWVWIFSGIAHYRHTCNNSQDTFSSPLGIEPQDLATAENQTFPVANFPNSDSKGRAANEETDSNSDTFDKIADSRERAANEETDSKSDTFDKVPIEETDKQGNYKLEEQRERTKELNEYIEPFNDKMRELEVSRRLLTKTTPELGKSRQMLSTIRRMIECSICLSTVRQPITLDCGHTFCSRCIGKWQRSGTQNGPFCPLCCRGISLTGTPVLMLRDIADDFRAYFEEEDNEEVSDDAETERSSSSDEDDNDEFFDALEDLSY